MYKKIHLIVTIISDIRNPRILVDYYRGRGVSKITRITTVSGE